MLLYPMLDNNTVDGVGYFTVNYQARPRMSPFADGLVGDGLEKLLTSHIYYQGKYFLVFRRKSLAHGFSSLARAFSSSAMR
jgi:hypothetical protein